MPTIAQLGDILNVVGIVERNASGGLEIAVDDPSDVVWLTAPGVTLGPARTGGPSPSAAALAATKGDTTTTSNNATIVALALLVVSGLLVGAALLASPSNRKRAGKWLQEASAALKGRLAQLRSG